MILAIERILCDKAVKNASIFFLGWWFLGPNGPMNSLSTESFFLLSKSQKQEFVILRQPRIGATITIRSTFRCTRHSLQKDATSSEVLNRELLDAWYAAVRQPTFPDGTIFLTPGKATVLARNEEMKTAKLS